MGAAGATGGEGERGREQEEGIRAPFVQQDQYDQAFQFSSCTFAFPVVIVLLLDPGHLSGLTS
jgi:hypothetical protein